MNPILKRLERAVLRLPERALPARLVEHKRELSLAEQKRALEHELRAAGYSKSHARALASEEFKNA